MIANTRSTKVDTQSDSEEELPTGLFDQQMTIQTQSSDPGHPEELMVTCQVVRLLADEKKVENEPSCFNFKKDVLHEEDSDEEATVQKQVVKEQIDDYLQSDDSSSQSGSVDLDISLDELRDPVESTKKPNRFWDADLDD